MIRLFQIVVFISAVLELSGCNNLQKRKPIWEQVKIGELAPTHRREYPREHLLKTINFKVFVFEIPADNIVEIDDLWQMLHRPNLKKSSKIVSSRVTPLKFDDYNAFIANSFLAGSGQIQTQGEVMALLREADGEIVETVSLLLFDNQPQTIPVQRLSSGRTIFYISSNGATEGITIGPGTLDWQIKADRVTGLTGLCSISVMPIFSPPKLSPIPELAEHARSKDVPFTCCRIRSRMTLGDFILLGKKEYIDHQTTLGALLFSKPGRDPVIRMYLFVCTGVYD